MLNFLYLHFSPSIALDFLRYPYLYVSNPGLVICYGLLAVSHFAHFRTAIAWAQTEGQSSIQIHSAALDCLHFTSGSVPPSDLACDSSWWPSFTIASAIGGLVDSCPYGSLVQALILDCLFVVIARECSRSWASWAIGWQAVPVGGGTAQEQEWMASARIRPRRAFSQDWSSLTARKEAHWWACWLLSWQSHLVCSSFTFKI